jgi:hypothetical protein
MNKEELQTIVSSKQAEYTNAKKESAQIKRKEYLLANKERIALQKKEWHMNHSDLLTIRNKQYYNNNKQKIHDMSTSKIQCSCGQTISFGYKRQHLLTKRHFINLGFQDLNNNK